MRKNLLLFGPVPISGLGDAAQYSVSAQMLHRALPESLITLLCPISGNTEVFDALPPGTLLAELGQVAFLTLGGFVRSPQRTDLGNSKEKSKRTIGGEILGAGNKAYRTLESIVPLFTWMDTGLATSRLGSPVFDGGLFGGHTCTKDIKNYILKYEIMKKMTKGPKIVSPISISKLGLAMRPEWRKRNLMRRLTKSLKGFDKVYARGKYTLNILSKEMGLENAETALDAGFGLRLYKDDKETQTITIIPRLDYFTLYKKTKLMVPYIKVIEDIISELRGRGYFINLSSQTRSGKYISRINIDKHDAGIKIRIPMSINECCNLYASSDLVISSYMHGGITALATGTPSIFIMPKTDVKTLDILTSVRLDPEKYFVNMFDQTELRFNSLIGKIDEILDDPLSSSRYVKKRIDSEYDTIHKPTRYLKSLLD